MTDESQAQKLVCSIQQGISRYINAKVKTLVELEDSSDSDIETFATAKMQYSSEAAFEECKRKAQRIFKQIDRYNEKAKHTGLGDLHLDSDDGNELLPP